MAPGRLRMSRGQQASTDASLCVADPHLSPPPSDVHQQLERNLASFLGQPSAIIYAQSFSCISSVIPAFAKRSDVLVIDRGCNFAIMKGAEVSRSKIVYYEHGVRLQDARSAELAQRC
jgi:7-keto-8-aminopelargonate synthetase-like enzyme